jgi:hypothetical protein
MLKAAGLHTFVNDLDAVPQGALLKAENTIIDRDGVIESRRGFKQYAEISPLSIDRAKQLFSYKDTLLAHYTDKLAFDDNAGNFTDFDGSYTELQQGLRIKGLEANGNFYFTTITGIKKISATSSSQFTSAPGYITDAGGIEALDVTAVINYSTPGFLLPESKVAYRVVWGYTDANDNLILGAPSARTVVTNISATNSAVVDLSFTIPEEISTTDTEYFYQIYRTAVRELGAAPSLDDIDPGDEMYLVLEDFPTVNELTVTRTIVVQDITPEDFRASGALLYTNLNSGEGILQANTPPPLAKDIASFQGSVFYANTSTKQQATISFLSVSQLVSGVSSITITNGTVANTYTFVGKPEITDIVFDTQANTIDGGYYLINAAGDVRGYFVWADKTGTTPEPVGVDTVGRLGIKIDLTAAVTADDVAQANLQALNATGDFVVTRLVDTLTITTNNNGDTTDAIDGIVGFGGTFAITIDQQGEGEDASQLEVLLSGAPTPAQQLDETARSLVRVINQNNNEIVYAFYVSGQDDLPGQILLRSRNTADPKFYISADSSTTASQFNPTLPVAQSGTAAIGAGTVTITITGHGYSNGQELALYDSTTTPVIDGIYTISGVTINTFNISATVNTAGNVSVVETDEFFSTNEVKPNRIYFSKYQQPEAVPIVNFIDIGPKDKAILRILALRDNLFIFKEEGIYRLSGTVAPIFTVALFDSSVILLAPDSAVVLNNQIYCLSTQGVARITDTGVGVISRPIEDKIQKVIIQNSSYKTASFGVSYETDRAYLLWVPFERNDTEATLCFRFNSFTQAWTEWVKSDVCGLVKSSDDKLYLGAASNIIEQERKDLERTDYADYQFDLNIAANSVIGTTVILSSNVGIEPGDIIVQTQYVTIATYNRLLSKLDADITIGDDDYFASLEMVAGDNLSNKIQALVAKLNADPNTQSVYTFSGTTDPETMQVEYNVIITTLNADPGVFQSDYRESIGTYDAEGQILQVINNTNKVILRLETPFVVGAVIHYVGINNDIIYAPQDFNDPSMYKQISEATFIFEDSVFTTARSGYNSDLSPNFEFIDFEGVGDGSWGNFAWSEQSWGGEGDQVPLRTYIPLEKQRCRFLRPRFQHGNAWEHYAIFGISFNPRVLSTRAYR